MGEYEFNVKMTCGGCSGAVSRALSKIEDITYDVSLEKQTVVVKGEVSYDEVLDKIKKTGKEVISGRVLESPVELADPVVVQVA